MTSRPLGLFDQEIRQRKQQVLGRPLWNWTVSCLGHVPGDARKDARGGPQPTARIDLFRSGKLLRCTGLHRAATVIGVVTFVHYLRRLATLNRRAWALTCA